MDGDRVVLDISSDEDVGFNWQATEGCDSDVDWTELFVNLESDVGDNDKKNTKPDDGYDSDEVVVIKEVLAKPKREKKFPGAQEEIDDDDCVVLEGDPDKPVEVVKDSGAQEEIDDDDDDLVIVSEKGQVACRDYPHPRHLCVKFPFGSTPHSDHCNICHCYVCDSPAPCGNWGDGNSITDHCHAFEKEAVWESERKRARHGGTAPAPVVNAAADEMAFWRDLLGQIPAHNLPFGQIPGSSGYIPGQGPSYDTPNIIRSQRTSSVSGRNRYCSNQPSQQQIINPCSNNLQRARFPTHNLHSVTPNLKRPRPIGRVGACKQARSNNSLSDFKHSYANHLMGIRLSSNTPRQLPMGHSNGIVNSNPPHNSSSVNSSQVSAGPMLSHGQAQLYGQPPARANSYPPVHPSGSRNDHMSTPATLTTAEYNPSQPSLSFTAASDIQGVEQLPLAEDQSWNNVNAWELLETQVLNDLPVLDTEDGIYRDNLWNF